MIKKHIITCTVIIALLIMAKVFAYHMPQTTNNKSRDKKTPPLNNAKTQEVLKEKAPVSQVTYLSFAEEALPLGDVKVDRKMKRFLAAHNYSRIQSNILHKKAAEWFPIIEPILAAYGIPEDFKYVPLVESGFRSGTSPKGAAGFWQFMPSTARSYGLKVSGRTDERKNLRKSTIAAAKYIKELYSIFDSWTLVAAAYNVGDVHMRKQISKQKQDNYFKLKLNRETGGYVYKLISMKQILEHPIRHGFKKSKTLLAYETRPFNVDSLVE